MSAVLQVVLPIETIAAIQRGEGLEQALQGLSIDPHPSARVIVDVARSAVATVNSMPYSLVPRTAAATAGQTAVQTPPIFTPPTTVEGPSTASVAEDHADDLSEAWVDAEAEEEYEEPNIHITVRDLMGKEYHHTVAGSADFQYEIAESYVYETGTSLEKLVFTLEDGIEILQRLDSSRGSYFSNTIENLGITDDTVVLVKPAAKTITVTFIDLMLAEKQIDVFETAYIHTLISNYLEHADLDGYELGYSTIYAGQETIIHPCFFHETIKEHSIEDGTVIMVKPMRHYVRDIKFTVRDAMNREYPYSFSNAATLGDLERAFCRDAGIKVGSVTLSCDGKTYGVYPHSIPHSSTLSDLGIIDGSIITASPAQRASAYQIPNYRESMVNISDANMSAEGNMGTGRSQALRDILYTAPETSW